MICVKRSQKSLGNICKVIYNEFKRVFYYKVKTVMAVKVFYFQEVDKNVSY